MTASVGHCKSDQLQLLVDQFTFFVQQQSSDVFYAVSGTHSTGVPSPGSAMNLSSSYSSRDRRMKRHRDKMIEHLLTSSVSDEKRDVRRYLFYSNLGFMFC